LEFRKANFCDEELFVETNSHSYWNLELVSCYD